MAAKRLNIRFVIILFVVMGLSAGVCFGLWKLNKSRLAEEYYKQGVALYDDPDPKKQEEAISFLLKYRQSDDKNDEQQADTLRKLAVYYAKNISRYVGDQTRVAQIRDIMQKALETDTRSAELKEAMAKAYTAMRQYVAAAKLYNALGAEFPNRPDYLYSEAENLIAANQIDDANFALVRLTSKHSSFIKGHLLYALYNEQVLGRPEGAENVMDEMVEANLQSAPAYARRSIYRLEHKNPEGAREDLDRALEIDRDSVDTLVAAAGYYIYQKELGKASAFLESIPPENRTNDDVSTLLIRLADAEKKPEEAIAQIRTKLEKNDNFILRVQLFDRLVATRQLEEARKEIAYLKKMRMSMEIIGFFESAIDIIEENWRSAVKKLELARSLFSSHPETVAYVDRQLALCYGKIGQVDKQLDAFQRAIDNTPQAEVLPISIAYILALNAAGKTTRLEEALRVLETKIGTAEVMKIPQLRAIKIAIEMQKVAGKTESGEDADNDWRKDLEHILNNSGVKAESQEAILVSARFLLKQGKIDEARKILKDAIKKEPEVMGYVSYLSLVEAQAQNYKEAVALLDNEMRKREVQPGLLVIKTRIVAQMPQEEAQPFLKSIESDLKSLPLNAQVAVMKQLGPAWLMTGDSDNAKRIFEDLARLEPDNMGTKIQLFDLARKLGDESEMNHQMEQIRAAQGVQSADYRYCQAAKIIWYFAQNKATIAQLAEAKTLLKQAHDSRQTWANVPRAQAELSLLEGNYEETINHLYRVDQLGALTMQQLELYVKLLYREGRDAEVKELLKSKSGMQMTDEILRIYAEVSEGSDAIEIATRIVRENSPLDHLWLGNLAMRAKDYRKAEESFRRAVEIMPTLSTGWTALLQAMKNQSSSNQRMQEEIENMQRAIPPEKLALSMGKVQQIVGNAEAAEKAFLEALDREPGSLEVLYSITSFYMQTTHPEFAEKYLQKMIHLLSEDQNTDHRIRVQQLAWARRSLAQIYGLHPDYDRQKRALQLLDENLRQEPDSVDDKKVKGLVLAMRKNPREQRQAIELLEGVPPQLMAPMDMFALAKLYDIQSVSNDSRLMWDKCQVIMKELTDLQKNKNPDFLVAFIDMLLRRKQEPANIDTYLKCLEELAPQQLATLALRTRLLQQIGNMDGAEKMLVARVPALVSVENINDVKLLAELLELIGSTNAAESVMQKMAAGVPRAALAYSAFLGRASRISDGLNVLEKNVKDLDRILVMDAVCTLFRTSKKVGTPAEFARAEELINSLASENDNPVAVALFRGQLRELQGNYDAAMKSYEEILNMPLALPPQKALAQNNMAYLLAATGKDIPGALAMINEAIAASGEQAGLMDTRATVCLKMSERIRIDQAVLDLEKAVSLEQKPLYYFHLALAYLKKDDRVAAKIAFETARQLDPNLAQNIPKLERDDYGTLVAPL